MTDISALDAGGSGSINWKSPSDPLPVPRADSPTAEREDHIEDRCHCCGGPNVDWSAPSPLWNAVMRDGDINASEPFKGIICPTCFAQIAEERGIATLWRFTAERVHVPLVTTTPSGRVWDPKSQLWKFSSELDDPVNHPAHYTKHPSGIECIDITEHMNFCLGNAVKYIWRADEKGRALEDLRKALWYLQRELSRREKMQGDS